jgi:putative DNA primase/helicase
MAIVEKVGPSINGGLPPSASSTIETSPHIGIEPLDAEAINSDLMASLIAAGCHTRDLGRAVYRHGVSVEQLEQLVLHLPIEHRVSFVTGATEAKVDSANGGLSVSAGRPALSVESLGSRTSGQRVQRLLERIRAGGVMDAGNGELRRIANALQDLSIPLAWFFDALVDAGVGKIFAYRYIRAFLPAWRGDRHLTDMGNGRRLISLYGQDIRYCPQRGWFVWDGKRWRVDAVGEMAYRAKQIADTWRRDSSLMYAIAMDAGDTPEAEAIAYRAGPIGKWAKVSESVAKLKAMVEAAQTEPGIPVLNAALDGDPWLLNVNNGTIELRTSTLRPHSRDDLITKLAPVNYRPGARFEFWDRFLDQITSSDLNYREYLQRAFGYAATGSVREEVFFFLYGPGGSGKSTLVKAIEKVLGDYAATADFDTFVKRPGGGSPRNDIARLDGRRMVLSIEVDEGRELAQGVVKTITGGDTVSARFLYKEFFEFFPTFKLVLVANDAPGVDPDDVAMWRRLRVLPMNNALPLADQDPLVKRLLTDPDIAGPAVLDWMVGGCRKWQAEGLGTCAAVQEATNEYRESEDILGEFLEECCTVGPGLEVKSAVAYVTYAKWAVLQGFFPPLTKNLFGRKLKKKGFTQGKLDGDRSWVGLTVEETSVDALSWSLMANPPQALPPGRRS